MHDEFGHNDADGTDFERSPSGGYDLVYHILDCEAPSCESAALRTTDPDETVYVCGNHTLEEFEEIAEVKNHA